MQYFYKASNETDQKEIDKLNQKCVELDKNLNNVEMNEIVLYFNETISHENSPLLLWKLAQEIKDHKGNYTIEILWREALLSIKYNNSKNKNEPLKFAEEFPSNFSQHLERGEPFELIDGDNLRFFNQDINCLLSNLYEKQYQKSGIIIENQNQKKRPPIVISIFGPQSSGKSTLLNYCFGCKFLTSAGRCTKGVYASLSKLSQPINHSDHFLILDTEGLDSIEKGKVLKETSCIHFDRTMVLFCLAVSQVVIINVKGDIGEELRNLLQICAYSLTKLKVSKVPAPKIFFVLNQQADPDPLKHLNSINTLLEDLKKGSDLIDDLSEGFSISDLIQVSRENLIVLPSAFNSFSMNTQLAKLFDSDLNKLAPTASFANKCAKFRMSIIKQLMSDEVHENQTSLTTLSEWLEMSGVIWDTIVKYQDIVKYRNVTELRCSKLLSEIVDQLLESQIYSDKLKYQQITEKLIEDIKRIAKWEPPNVILEDVKKTLDEIFQEYRENAITEFVEKCHGESLLKKMDHMCDDSKSNLCRLIYMEKKIYEDKLRIEIKARLVEIKKSENMAKFQKAIEKNADQYLELNLEQQTGEFEKIWINCFGSDNKNEEDMEREEIFDNLYIIFSIESKTMENKEAIYTQFRAMNFDMNIIIQTLGEKMIAKFSNEPNIFLYPWRENKAPLKDMIPFPGIHKFEYLSKESLWLPFENQNNSLENKVKLRFQKWVPPHCYPLIQYCSGFYNHPDIIWNVAKREQVLLLASELKDPRNLERSTWEKFISDISQKIEGFIEKDPNISHSTVKEIVNFLCNICKVVNYEINFIEAKLTNAAERNLSTCAFAFALKSLLDTKTEKHRKNKMEINRKREANLKYFLQKVENGKIARGNWNRKEMRKGDKTMANIFATNCLESIWRGVNTTCERNINEDYFNENADKLSHKSLLLLANEKILKDLNTCLESVTEDHFVVQFVCDQTKTLRMLFHVEWLKVSNSLRNNIIQDMKQRFTHQITTLKLVLSELLDGIVAICKGSERPDGIGLDSDSNFVVCAKAIDDESVCNSDSSTKIAPFKAMVLFLEMYLNPKVSSEEFNHFFNNPFKVDGIFMEKHDETYVLYEKADPPIQDLTEEIFQKLSETKMFSSTETIFNIKVYIEEFLHVLTTYEYQVTLAQYEKLLKATKEQFETRVINCPNRCPSCGKFCEKELHPHEGRCQIMTGHQICSMGGKVWKTDEDRSAILLMCEDYEDDMQVLIPDVKMKWWEFTEICGNQWDWDLPKDVRYTSLQIENREKVKNIWKKFGRKILKYYENEGTPIKYIEYTTPKEIYESLFQLKSYICFVIDGAVKEYILSHFKRWVSEIIEGFDDIVGFKVIIYHGDCSVKNFLQVSPDDVEFTSNKHDVQSFLENITPYGDEDDEFPMLHGLAAAATGCKWESGFGIRNKIVHIYIEPTQGFFDFTSAIGNCGQQSCTFNWDRDINGAIEQNHIQYIKTRFIGPNHPSCTNSGSGSGSHSLPSALRSLNESQPNHEVFINYIPDS